MYCLETWVVHKMNENMILTLEMIVWKRIIDPLIDKTTRESKIKKCRGNDKAVWCIRYEHSYLSSTRKYSSQKYIFEATKIEVG